MAPVQAECTSTSDIEYLQAQESCDASVEAYRKVLLEVQDEFIISPLPDSSDDSQTTEDEGTVEMKLTMTMNHHLNE